MIPIAGLALPLPTLAGLSTVLGSLLTIFVYKPGWSGEVHRGRLLKTGLLVALGIAIAVAPATEGLYPAWRAARLWPVEALRYE